MEAAESVSTRAFACSICWCEIPRSPVVTCCGHIFCWSCIYRWLCKESSCPVCKGALFLQSPTSFTPIYSSFFEDDDIVGPVEEGGLQIPPRPSAQRAHSASGDVNLHMHAESSHMQLHSRIHELQREVAALRFELLVYASSSEDTSSDDTSSASSASSALRRPAAPELSQGSIFLRGPSTYAQGSTSGAHPIITERSWVCVSTPAPVESTAST